MSTITNSSLESLTMNKVPIGPAAPQGSIHLPIQDTRTQSPGREGPLEEGMATHSSVLAWGIPWTEEPGRLQSMGSQESQTRLSD